MSNFIPPYPKRPANQLGPLELVKSARDDLLSIWPESLFDRQFVVIKILNRSIFIANHPEIVNHVLLKNHGNYEKKSALIRRTLLPLLGDSLFISDGAAWRQHRELATPMFHNDRLAGYSEVMVNTAEDWVRKWSALTPGTRLPILPEMRQLTAAMLSRILFGKQVTAEQASLMAANFSAYLETVGQMDLNTLFGLPSWFSNKSAGKSGKTAKALHELMDKLIADYKTSDDDTLVAQFLAGQGSAAPLTHEQIRNELLALFMVGYETIANTLTWVWYMISQCPEVEQRLHEEVDRVLGAESASFDYVGRLAYTRAIIEETLRLYPPLPILIREASADDSIRKRPIPAGSMIVVAPWLLHRHKQYWDNPDHFMPERFLENAPAKPDPLIYIPFSVGPRACLAQEFSLLATTLCLATLAKNARLQTSKAYRLEPVCRLLLRPNGDLPMQISMRSSAFV